MILSSFSIQNIMNMNDKIVVLQTTIDQFQAYVNNIFDLNEQMTIRMNNLNKKISWVKFFFFVCSSRVFFFDWYIICSYVSIFLSINETKHHHLSISKIVLNDLSIRKKMIHIRQINHFLSRFESKIQLCHHRHQYSILEVIFRVRSSKTIICSDQHHFSIHSYINRFMSSWFFLSRSLRLFLSRFSLLFSFQFSFLFSSWSSFLFSFQSSFFFLC